MPRTPSTLDQRLKSVKTTPTRTGPLWAGPCAEGPLGGVTFSMLSRWLSCRERARVQYIEGIKPAERFNHRTDYGTMWHLCEEELAAAKDGDECWVKLSMYLKELERKFPMDREAITHWGNVCLKQFPIYCDYWSKHDDVKKRTPLMQEQVFDVPYKLPSGRTVRLRGKFDSVDLIDGGVWLQENKTKGDIDIQAIQRQLTWDLQTMLYLIALSSWYPMGIAEIGKPPSKGHPVYKIKGVRYNVVRRPLSGGKGTIVRHKPTKSNPQGESWDSYYKRVEQVIRDDPGHFFSRWKTEITPHDIQRFRTECLDPILENVCCWHDHVSGRIDPTELARGVPPFNWRHPFGAVNTIDEYGASDIDEYLNNGSMTGLRRIDKLFEELT